MRTSIKWRVGFDATPAAVKRRTGTEQYAHELAWQFATLQRELPDIELIAYLHAGNPHSSVEQIAIVRRCFDESGIRCRVYTPRRGYGLALSIFTVIDRLDLLHMLRVGRPWRAACPYVITVFDVLMVDMPKPGHLREYVILTESGRNAIRGANGLIGISASIEEELKAEFSPDELSMPLWITHLGYNPAFLGGPGMAAQMRNKYGLDRYVLFVGTQEHHKNLPRLIEAFAQVKAQHVVPHRLVLAGGMGNSSDAIRTTIEQLRADDIVLMLGYVPDDDLPGLYAGADLFVFPSLHEGFGIPILEAMASGTVVLTSNSYAMPEVAGDAAVYVDPNDMESIAIGLWRGLSDEQIRQDLCNKGTARVARFTWRNTAFETLDFYRFLLEKGKSKS